VLKHGPEAVDIPDDNGPGQDGQDDKK
jgi:hypothetical protein